MANLQLQFLNYSSSEEDTASRENLQEAMSFGCSKIELETTKTGVTTRSAKRSRNADINPSSASVSGTPRQSTDRLLTAQLEVQTKLYDALAKSLEETRRNCKSMQYNTRRMYEALERMSAGSVNLIRAMEAQNIEEARHHRVMENLAKKELQINQKLLDLKLKKLEMATNT